MFALAMLLFIGAGLQLEAGGQHSVSAARLPLFTRAPRRDRACLSISNGRACHRYPGQGRRLLWRRSAHESMKTWPSASMSFRSSSARSSPAAHVMAAVAAIRAVSSKLKQRRRIATRYDKRAANFLGSVKQRKKAIPLSSFSAFGCDGHRRSPVRPREALLAGPRDADHHNRLLGNAASRDYPRSPRRRLTSASERHFPVA